MQKVTTGLGFSRAPVLGACYRANASAYLTAPARPPEGDFLLTIIILNNLTQENPRRCARGLPACLTSPSLGNRPKRITLTALLPESIAGQPPTKLGAGACRFLFVSWFVPFVMRPAGYDRTPRPRSAGGADRNPLRGGVPRKAGG